MRRARPADAPAASWVPPATGCADLAPRSTSSRASTRPPISGQSATRSRSASTRIDRSALPLPPTLTCAAVSTGCGSSVRRDRPLDGDRLAECGRRQHLDRGAVAGPVEPLRHEPRRQQRQRRQRRQSDQPCARTRHLSRLRRSRRHPAFRSRTHRPGSVRRCRCRSAPRACRRRARPTGGRRLRPRRPPARTARCCGARRR